MPNNPTFSIPAKCVDNIECKTKQISWKCIQLLPFSPEKHESPYFKTKLHLIKLHVTFFVFVQVTSGPYINKTAYGGGRPGNDGFMQDFSHLHRIDKNLLSDGSNIRRSLRPTQNVEENLIRAVASDSNDLSLYSAIEEFISDEIDQIESELHPQKSSSLSTQQVSQQSTPKRNQGDRRAEQRRQSQKPRRRKTKWNRSRRRHVRQGGNKYLVNQKQRPQRKRHISSLTLDSLVGKDPEGPFAGQDQGRHAKGGGLQSTKFKFRPKKTHPKREKKKLPVQDKPEFRNSVSPLKGKQVLGPVYNPKLKHTGKSTPLPYPKYEPRTRPQRHNSNSVRYRDLFNSVEHEPHEVSHFTSTLSSGKKYKGFRPSPPDLYRNYITRPSDPDLHLNAYNDASEDDTRNDYHPHQDFKLPFPSSLKEMIKITDVENGINFGHNFEDHQSTGPVAEYGPTIFLPIVPVYRPSYTHVVSNEIGKDTHPSIVEELPLEDNFETLYYPGKEANFSNWFETTRRNIDTSVGTNWRMRCEAENCSSLRVFSICRYTTNHCRLQHWCSSRIGWRIFVSKAIYWRIDWIILTWPYTIPYTFEWETKTMWLSSIAILCSKIYVCWRMKKRTQSSEMIG